MISVKDFGAAGDGVTDDSSAINAAIDALSSTGGGMLALPFGVYVVASTIVLKSNVIICGDGFGRSVLKAADNTSHDVVESFNFPSLTGTNTAAGPLCFGLRDLTIYGNRYNRTGSGTCLRIYGYDYELTNVEIYDGRGIGFYSEWAIIGNVPVTPYGKDTMEAHITGLRVFRCMADGVSFYGPHDTICSDILTFINSGKGAVFGSNSTSTAGGVMVDQMHSYGNASWGIVIDTILFAGHIESEWNIGGGGIQVNAPYGNVSGGILNAWSNAGPGVEINNAGSTTDILSHHNTGNGVNLFAANNQLSINSYSNSGDGIVYGANAGNNTASPCRSVGNSGKAMYLQGNDNRVLGLCGIGNGGGVVVNGAIGGLRMDGELSVNGGTQMSFGSLGAPCIIDLITYTKAGQIAWSGNPGNNFVRIATAGASNMPLNRAQV